MIMVLLPRRTARQAKTFLFQLSSSHFKRNVPGTSLAPLASVDDAECRSIGPWANGTHLSLGFEPPTGRAPAAANPRSSQAEAMAYTTHPHRMPWTLVVVSCAGFLPTFATCATAGDAK